MALRYDTFQCDVSKVRRTPSGGLAVPSHIARTGVQRYRDPDGTERVEYRPPDEVFSVNSLDSFRAAALTSGHPDTPVSPETWSDVAVGQVGDDVRQDGEYVAATLYLQCADAITKVTRDGIRELSCGYSTDLEETPGIAPDGSRYDAIQRNIRGNHVALVFSGRAGSEVSIHLDERQMMDFILKIDGKDFPVQAENDDVVAAVQSLQKRLDSIDALVHERLEIVEMARKIRPTISVDNRTNIDIMRECVSSDFRVDADASPDYVRGLFFAIAKQKDHRRTDSVEIPEETRVSGGWTPTPLAASNRSK